MITGILRFCLFLFFLSVSRHTALYYISFFLFYSSHGIMDYRSRREDYNDAGYCRRYEDGDNPRQKPQKARRKTFSTSLTSCSTMGRSIFHDSNFISTLDPRLGNTMPGLIWKTLGNVQKLTILWYLERYQTKRGSKPLTVMKKLRNTTPINNTNTPGYHRYFHHSLGSFLLSTSSSVVTQSASLH